MANYMVTCVSMDYEADVDDCRCIEEIGFVTSKGNIVTRSPGQVHQMIAEEDHTVVVEYHGDQHEVAAVERDGRRYVRTAETDTSDDKLLKKPSC